MILIGWRWGDAHLLCRQYFSDLKQLSYYELNKNSRQYKDLFEFLHACKAAGCNLNSRQIINPSACWTEGLPGMLRAESDDFDAGHHRTSPQSIACVDDYYRGLATLGVDLRPTIAGAYDDQPPLDLSDDKKSTLRSEAERIKSFGYEALKQALTAGEEGVSEENRNTLCATGLLPRYLHILGQQGDAPRLNQFTNHLDEYWRGEYAHSLHAAEAVCTRHAAQGNDTAMNAWARGG